MKKIVLLFLVVYIISTPTLRAGSGWGVGLGLGLGIPLAVGTGVAIAHAHDEDRAFEEGWNAAERARDQEVDYTEPVVHELSDADYIQPVTYEPSDEYAQPMNEVPEETVESEVND